MSIKRFESEDFSPMYLLKNRYGKGVIMSPKQKAQQLINKFKDYVHGYIGSSMLSNTEFPELILDRTKILTHTVIDEIIRELHHGQEMDWIKERVDGQEYITYWNEVKLEVENYKTE